MLCTGLNDSTVFGGYTGETYLNDLHEYDFGNLGCGLFDATQRD